jgi:hypothetical protein
MTRYLFSFRMDFFALQLDIIAINILEFDFKIAVMVLKMMILK